MHAPTPEPRLEDWHDFEVGSRKEIIALLRGICDERQSVHMLIHGQCEVAVSSILDVDADANSVILDCPFNEEQNRLLLAAGAVLLETMLDKIRILFSIENIKACRHDDSPAFRIALPASLIRLQRREYYRTTTPVGNPVRVNITLPAELGGGNGAFPLADISCGGISILDHDMLLGDTIGKHYSSCRIELPEVGTVTTSLQIRNSVDMTLLNSKSKRRLGCQFIDIPRTMLAQVQRHITQVERQRNARIVGFA